MYLNTVPYATALRYHHHVLLWESYLFLGWRSLHLPNVLKFGLIRANADAFKTYPCFRCSQGKSQTLMCHCLTKGVLLDDVQKNPVPQSSAPHCFPLQTLWNLAVSTTYRFVFNRTCVLVLCNDAMSSCCKHKHLNGSIASPLQVGINYLMPKLQKYLTFWHGLITSSEDFNSQSIKCWSDTNPAHGVLEVNANCLLRWCNNSRHNCLSSVLRCPQFIHLIHSPLKNCIIVFGTYSSKHNLKDYKILI